jgi:hypothetical protein
MNSKQDQTTTETLARRRVREPAGLLDMHFVVRLLTNRKGVQEVLGFLTYKDGLPGEMFSGDMSEKTAHFTLRIEALTAKTIGNTGTIHIQLRPPGQRLRIFLNRRPSADWNDPESFSKGELIATYYERVAQLIDLGPVAESTATFALESANEFSWGGEKYNFMRDTPSGVTAVSYFSMTPTDTTIDNYSTALCGAGVGYTIEAPPGPSSRDREHEVQEVLEGSFIDTITQPDRKFKALFTFTPGGAMVGNTYDSEGKLAIAHGAWEKIEHREFALTFIFLGLEGKVPYIRLKVRARIQLPESMDSYEGKAQMDYYDNSGTLLRSVVAPVKGERINAEELEDTMMISQSNKPWTNPALV